MVFSLNEAKKNFRTFGACSQDMTSHTRKPLPEEIPFLTNPPISPKEQEEFDELKQQGDNGAPTLPPPIPGPADSRRYSAPRNAFSRFARSGGMLVDNIRIGKSEVDKQVRVEYTAHPVTLTIKEDNRAFVLRIAGKSK